MTMTTTTGSLAAALALAALALALIVTGSARLQSCPLAVDGGSTVATGAAVLAAATLAAVAWAARLNR